MPTGNSADILTDPSRAAWCAANTVASHAMRIRTRLLILVLAVLVPAFIAAALAIAYVYDEESTAFEQSMRETARALALLLDNEFAKQEGIVRALAASPMLDNLDYTAFYAHAQAAIAGTDSNITLSNLAGVQFLNTRLPFGELNARQGPFAALRKHYGPTSPIVSDLYVSLSTGRYSFGVEVPVQRGGNILHYIEIGSPASRLQNLFERQRLPEGWIGTIVDRRGIVVARTRDADKLVGKSVTEALALRIASAREGMYTGPTLNGGTAVGFFAHAPNSEWTFIVGVPQAVVMRAAVRASALVGGVALLLIALAVAGAILAARHTSRAIEALRHSAEDLGRGGRARSQRWGIAEIDAASRAMAWASDEIHTHRTELERRVATAVADAERSQRALLQAQKLEALGRLTGGIAHDFNNVLQTLTSGLQLAHLSSADGRIKSLIESCQRAVERAVELTRQLMAFGRVQDARLETIDVTRQIVTMTPLLKGGLPSNIEFGLDVAPDLWPVTVDTLQFELALLNLTMNARDALPHGGHLHIAVANASISGASGATPGSGPERRSHEKSGDLPAGDYVRIAVIDSGEGMAPEVLAKAVDPFFTTKGVGTGSGMGLPQAYGFAKQSGGALVLRSKPDVGTEATLYLPRAKNAVMQKSPEPGTKPVPRAAADKHVLFVEDDPLVRDVVGPALREVGFTVSIATDAEAALSMLESGAPVDLVFSDIVMPGKIGGIELAQAVKARFPRIRVVLATGYSDRRIDLPGVRILAKPYEVAALVDLLNDALRSA
jgi:signal transduction histidine kinase